MSFFKRKPSLGLKTEAPPPETVLVQAAKAATTQLDVEMSVFTSLAETAQNTTETIELEYLSIYLSDTLKSKRHQVIMMGLLALETLFLQCDSHIHAALSIPEIVNPMVALVERQKKKGFENIEVSNRALDLFRAWGEGFRILQNYGSGKLIVETYKELLRQKWIIWPNKSTPLFDPNSPICVSKQRQLNHTVGSDSPKPLLPRKPASMRPGSLKTFASSEVASFRGDFDAFDLTITAFETEMNECNSYDEVDKNSILPELALSCHRISPQLLSMIEIISSTVQDPTVLDPFLKMNDRLNQSLNKHKKLSQKPEFDALANNSSVSSKKDVSASINPFDDDDIASAIGLQTSPVAPPRFSPPSTNPFDTFPRVVDDDNDEDLL